MVVAQALHHSSDATSCWISTLLNIQSPYRLAVTIPPCWPKRHNWLRTGDTRDQSNVGCPAKGPGRYSGLPDGRTRSGRPLRGSDAERNRSAVTVKHRIGIDDLDSDALLTAFVIVAQAGAVLPCMQSMAGRADPKQNRTIPPLQHERVCTRATSRIW